MTALNSIPSSVIQAEYSTHPDATWELIYPDTARSYLARNNNSMPLVRTHWAKIAIDIKAGRWVPTGDPIRFNERGELIDGQHRLMACVVADIPIMVLAVRGVKQFAQCMMDKGRTRTHSALLTNRGVQQAAAVSGAAFLLYKLYVGRLAGCSKPNDAVLDDIIRVNAKLQDSAVFFASLKQSQLLTKPIGTCLHYLFSVVSSQEQADEFWSESLLGSNDPTSPTTLLHHRLIARDKLPPSEKIGLSIMAWKNWTKGKRARSMRVPSDLPTLPGLNIANLMPPSAIEFAREMDVLTRKGGTP